MAFTGGLGKERRVENGDVIEGVISEGVDHDEFIIGNTPTPVPDPPPGSTVMIFHNDSGALVRYGGPDVAWAAAADTTDPKRGFPVANDRGFSLGLADHNAKKIYFIAQNPGTKTIIGFGV